MIFAAAVTSIKSDLCEALISANALLAVNLLRSAFCYGGFLVPPLLFSFSTRVLTCDLVLIPEQFVGQSPGVGFPSSCLFPDKLH